MKEIKNDGFIKSRIKEAASILRRGGLVAFPTETVYGLGARVSNRSAVRRIFEVKGRPHDNPLIVHIASSDQLSSLVSAIPPVAKRLIALFWPGPLTLVFKRREEVSSLVSAGLDTIAIRSPDHPIAQALLGELNEAIAAPSANRSGRPSPTSCQHVARELGKTVDFILDGGPCRVGLESTVLDLTKNPPCLLRPGAITAERLRSVIGDLGTIGSEPARSPGMRHRHYAPDFKVILVPPRDLQTAMGQLLNPKKRLGVLCRHKGPKPAGLAYYRQFEGSAALYARNLFSSFYEAEAAKVEVLLVEDVKRQGFGAAIMDRLERAAGREMYITTLCEDQ